MKKSYMLTLGAMISLSVTMVSAYEFGCNRTVSSKYSYVSSPDDAGYGQTTTCTYKGPGTTGYTPIYVTDYTGARGSNTCSAVSTQRTAQNGYAMGRSHTHNFSDYSQ